MGHNLIQQQDWGNTAARGHKAGIGQHDGDQQRLLLAGRAELGGLVLGRVAHQEIRPVRAFQREAGGGIARPAGSQCCAIAVFHR